MPGPTSDHSTQARAARQASLDPWAIEAERAGQARGFRRPSFGPVPRARIYALGILAALRAAGLVLVAEAVARGIAALADGDLSAETTRLVVVLGIAGALLRSGGEWGTSVVARRIATDVKRDIRGRLWRRIAGGDAGEGGGGAGGGTAVLAADGLDDLDDYYVQSLPAVIAAAVVPLLVGLRVLGADWLSAVIIVLTVPLIPVFMVLIGKHTQQRTDAALGALTRLADHLAELARGLPVLVGLGRVEEQAKALEQLQRGYRERTQETLRWAFLSALALELIATISVALVAVFLGLRLLHGTMELEPALIALILAPEAYSAIRQVGTAFHASQDGLSALERTQAMLDRPVPGDVRSSAPPVEERAEGTRPIPPVEERAEGTRPIPPVEERAEGTRLETTTSHAAALPPPHPRIRLDALSVRYAGRDAPTLTGVTAELAGIVAIAGPSGAGKSTLLAALTGTLPSDAVVGGRITGIDVDAVGWAPQAPRAFAGSPREELALYGADALQALEELGLAHVADSAVPELSPGEQRRLAVARALARVDAGARLLVLDEPTAHLDRDSADRVRSAILRRAERAVIVLASHERETTALATATIAVGAPARSLAASPSPSPDRVAASRAGESPFSATRRNSARGAARAATRATATSRLRVRTLIRPHLARWAGAIALAAIAVGMGLALTAVSGWLIVRATVEEHIMVLMVAIVGVRAFGIFRSVGRYADRLATHHAAFRVVDELRLRLWRSIAARGAGSRRLLEGGAPLDYLVTLADELRDQLPRVLPPIGVGLVVIAGAVVSTAFVAPQLARVVALVLVLATALAAALAITAERGAAGDRIAARSELVRGTAALATAASDLRGNGVASVALSQLDAAADRLASAERRAAWAAGLGSAVVTAAMTTLAFLVPVLGAALPGPAGANAGAAASGLPAEGAAVIALLSLALLEPLVDLVAAVHRIPAMRAVLARLGPVLRLAPQPTWGETTPASPVAAVALDDVAVRYPGMERPAIEGVDGAATADRWLVLDGPSGSGKSTLLSAIMGALPVEQGAIRVASSTALQRAAPNADAGSQHAATLPRVGAEASVHADAGARHAHMDAGARDAHAQTDAASREDAHAHTDATAREDAHAQADATAREDAHAKTDAASREDAHAQTDARAREDAHAKTDAASREDAHAHTDAASREDAHAHTDATAREDAHAQTDATAREDAHAHTVAAAGLPLTELDERAWRSRVAWCPQDAYVFDSTLRGNLLLARSKADAPDESTMRQVLGQAGLGPLLTTLAKGLDTRVGAGGSALSGGERQRLAVARALLTRADVILLDEPTAHLDAPTASAMMTDVRAATAGRVVVLVSHRADDREPGDTVVRLG